MSIFCDCEKCGCSIQEGDQCYSLMFSKDFVGYDQVVPHPERFTRELLLNDVHTRDYAVGRVEFGRYGGRKVVIEQNASPLLVYWKGE